MGKLLADLLLRRESYLNPLKDREMDLRGLNIPAIENLGVTKNQLDSLDLSDNAITALSNLPHLPRLKHILLNNNPLTSISPNIARAVPNLQSLFLASTSIQSIKDLTPLKSCPRLEFLSLRDAPVTRQPNYRSWLIFSCPSLRVIDFEKVKLKEREHAKSLFLTEDGKPTPLAQTIATATANGATNGASAESTSSTSKSFEPGSEPAAGAQGDNKGRLLTAQDKQRIKQAIEAATTLEEVKRLQRSLEEGFVPSDKELEALRGQGNKTGANGA